MASGLRRYKTYELSTVVEQEIEPSFIRTRGRRCRQTLVGRSVKGIRSQGCHFIRAACDDLDVSTGSCTLFIVFRHKKMLTMRMRFAFIHPSASGCEMAVDERCLIGGWAGYGYIWQQNILSQYISLVCFPASTYHAKLWQLWRRQGKLTPQVWRKLLLILVFKVVAA